MEMEVGDDSMAGPSRLGYYKQLLQQTQHIPRNYIHTTSWAFQWYQVQLGLPTLSPSNTCYKQSRANFMSELGLGRTWKSISAWRRLAIMQILNAFTDHLTSVVDREAWKAFIQGCQQLQKIVLSIASHNFMLIHLCPNWIHMITYI